MNSKEAENILEIASAVETSLHKDVITLENMLFSTDEQIDSMQEVCRRLKKIRNGVLSYYDEYGLDAEEFILTMGHSLLPLAKCICKLEARRDSLKLSRDNLHAAVRAANRFTNKVSAIPKME